MKRFNCPHPEAAVPEHAAIRRNFGLTLYPENVQRRNETIYVA